MKPEPADAFTGCLLGTAVGDSLGLPYEGMSARRAARMFPDTARHHFLFGKGMVSDDTEHACFTAQAIIESKGEVDEFRRILARSLRWWLLGLPAGVGLATLRSILRLWLGISPSNSGVFSAGNGPSMRSPVIGVAFGEDAERLKACVKASTEITHRDPKAYFAALAVAAAATADVGGHSPWPEAFRDQLESLMPEADARELHGLIGQAAISAADDEPVTRFAERIGSAKGISGYSYHTVPCVLQVWFKHGDDFEKGLRELIGAGGDTDTAGAIFGGIVGARAGKECIPEQWLDDLVEWPRSVRWIESLGEKTALACANPGTEYRAGRSLAPLIVLRNLLFLVIVLAHGFRRLAPPY